MAEQLANLMRKISSTTWTTYGLVFGFVTLNGAGISLFMHHLAQRTFMATAHYKMAMNIFDEHNEAKRLLGKPVKVGKMNLFDKSRNYMRKTESGLHIPVCGTHSSGFLDVLATKTQYEKMFTTQRMVLEMDGGERFLMFNRPTKEEEAEAEEKRRKEAEQNVPKKKPRGR